MPIEIMMPALSPTMEEGTLAKWLVRAGDAVKPGDLLAEVETDKATMEFEAVDEGVIASIAVAEGTDGVKVGTVIATLATDGEAVDVPRTTSGESPAPPVAVLPQPPAPGEAGATERASTLPPVAKAEAVTDSPGDATVAASPLARRLAGQLGVDLTALAGSGPDSLVVKADIAKAAGLVGPTSGAATPVSVAAPTSAAPQAHVAVPDVPHEAVKLTGMRRTIARRLTESKQQVPHIYLTVTVRLDALLALRGDMNAGLAARGVKLSVNDMLVKALAAALGEVPSCNVMFTPDQLVRFDRADISVAVSTPGGLITPVVTNVGAKSLSAISTEIKSLAALARDNKLKPEQYQGGTASISNMGMYGITQFDAVINPPQGMILAVAAGERRPWVMADDTLGIATVMSATGSFDHRAIDGADAAAFMRAFKALVESPLALIA